MGERRQSRNLALLVSLTLQKLFWPSYDWNNNATLNIPADANVPASWEAKKTTFISGMKHALISFTISPTQPNLPSQCRPLVLFNYLRDNNVGSLPWHHKTTVIAQQLLLMWGSVKKTNTYSKMKIAWDERQPMLIKWISHDLSEKKYWHNETYYSIYPYFSYCHINSCHLGQSTSKFTPAITCLRKNSV